jgi:hypothetical protein
MDKAANNAGDDMVRSGEIKIEEYRTMEIVCDLVLTRNSRNRVL